MKNRFQIVQCRCKVGDSDKILVKGWYRNNIPNDEKIVFSLGKKKLEYTEHTHTSIEIKMKYVENKLGIDTEYMYEVDIPVSAKQKEVLKIFQFNEEEKQLIHAVQVSKIRRMQKKIVKWIETPTIKEKTIEIRGWYISDTDIDIKIYDQKKVAIPFRKIEEYRKDVVVEYKEIDAKHIKGFKLILEKLSCKKVLIVLKDGKKEQNYMCSMSENVLKYNFEKLKKKVEKTIGYYRRYGLKRTVDKIFIALAVAGKEDYELWRVKNLPKKNDLKVQMKKEFYYKPQFSIVVPLYKTDPQFLKAIVSSIKEQTYTNWELYLSDGSGENSPLKGLLRGMEKKDARIKVIENKTSLQIAQNTNEALKIAKGDYIVFADHDDLLAPNALYECAEVLNKNPNIEFIYTDEDKISMDGQEYFHPHFKPDFNIDLLRCVNYICHMVVVKKELIEKVGLLNPKFNGAQDYDFVLRCIEETNEIFHIPQILYHWRMHKDSTAENPESKMYAFDAGVRAIQEHYDRVGIHAEVTHGQALGTYRSKYKVEKQPLVSIVIPNKDHVEDLDKCITSIERKSSYKNIEYVIVENNSEEKETFSYYDKLQQENARVSVVYWKEKFNYSAINNFGVNYAKGEYIWLLNNDTEILNGDCIGELLGYCMREDVGVVGSRLYYPDDTIQHAGVIIGMGGIAGHSFLNCEKDDPGYFGRIICAQDVSAVTAASMMIKRTVFDEVKGLDEKFEVAFNDVDFCMKVRKEGYLIVYTPYSELYHYESKSRGEEDTPEKIERFNNEVFMFSKKWSQELKNGDPYYNINLALDKDSYSLRL